MSSSRSGDKYLVPPVAGPRNLARPPIGHMATPAEQSLGVAAGARAEGLRPREVGRRSCEDVQGGRPAAGGRRRLGAHFGDLGRSGDQSCLCEDDWRLGGRPARHGAAATERRARRGAAAGCAASAASVAAAGQRGRTFASFATTPTASLGSGAAACCGSRGDLRRRSPPTQPRRSAAAQRHAAAAGATFGVVTPRPHRVARRSGSAAGVARVAGIVGRHHLALAAALHESPSLGGLEVVVVATARVQQPEQRHLGGGPVGAMVVLQAHGGVAAERRAGGAAPLQAAALVGRRASAQVGHVDDVHPLGHHRRQPGVARVDHRPHGRHCHGSEPGDLAHLVVDGPAPDQRVPVDAHHHLGRARWSLGHWWRRSGGRNLAGAASFGARSASAGERRGRAGGFLDRRGTSVRAVARPTTRRSCGYRPAAGRLDRRTPHRPAT